MRTSVRWLVPIAAVAAVAGGVAVNSAQAGSASDVTPRSPEQVLASIAAAHVTALSGTVVTRADIGLPSLSGLGGGEGTSGTDATGLVTRFLSGKNTLRVWTDGPTRSKAQLMDPLSEFDVVRNGTDLWTYTSRGNTVQHGTAPQHSDTRSTAPSAGAMASMTPDQLAAKAIATADPTTEISVGPSQVVAGRSAYALTLTPRDKGTLIDHIVIGVDAEKSVPLQVKVFARGHGDPVIETGFTDVDFSTPPASTFAFTPPKGATVTQLGTGDHSATQPKKPAGGSTATTPTVTGTGWASIVELPASAMQAMASGSAASHPGSTGSTGSGPSSAAAMMQLTTPVAGGRALSTSLVSVLLTNDGRVFAGSVPVQALVDAAAK